MTGQDTRCAGCGAPMRSCVVPAYCGAECREKRRQRVTASLSELAVKVDPSAPVEGPKHRLYLVAEVWWDTLRMLYISPSPARAAGKAQHWAVQQKLGDNVMVFELAMGDLEHPLKSWTWEQFKTLAPTLPGPHQRSRV